jgi:hypothetical protein
MTERAFDRFVIFSIMRSGSNLLERFLDQYDGLACHGELFNPLFIGKTGQLSLFGISVENRRKNPASLLTAIDAAMPHQLNGLRYFPAHDEVALHTLIDDPRCAKIILQRNPVDSFVSQCIAEYSDIWLIGSEKDRMPVSVPVSVGAFRKYCVDRNAFFGRIERRLATTGQQALRINYGDLLDLDKINALAMTIGARAPLAALQQPIKRQNPGPLQAKITNYAEVYEELGLPKPAAIPGAKILPAAEDPSYWVWPRHYYTCDDIPLAFAPLLANTKQPIAAWLNLLPGNNRTGLHFDQLEKWRDFHEGATVLTVLHHPLDRLYETFMNKIFSTAPDAFQKIRRILERRYQIYLPENARAFDPAQYTLDDHRTAFQQFLVFIAANLRNETDIRQDGNWLPQAQLIDIFADILPITKLIKQADLDIELPKLEAALHLPQYWAQLRRYNHAPHVYQLADIYDAQTEAMARAAYPEDYARFGFDDWAPGQAAFDASLPVKML